MKVKNKTYDILYNKYNHLLTEERVALHCDTYKCEIAAIRILIDNTYNAEKEEWHLTPQIAWCYSTSTEVIGDEYPTTLEGLKRACEWLDEQRGVFCEQLL